MKKLLAVSVLLLSQVAMATSLALKAGEVVSADDIINSGQASVSCEVQDVKPKCVVVGKKFGVLLPGQQYEDIEFYDFHRSSEALSHAQAQKKMGICD